MKKITLKILILTFSLSLIGLFSYSFCEEIYPEPSWLDKEYYKTEEYLQNREVSDRTKLKWYMEISKEALNEGYISKEYYYKFIDECKKSYREEKGFYSPQLLLSSLRLNCYGIFYDQMELIENLHSKLPAFKGIKMLIEFYDHTDIALTMKYKHPFKNLNDEFSPYVGYGYRSGWFDNFNLNPNDNFSYSLYKSIEKNELNIKDLPKNDKLDNSNFTMGDFIIEMDRSLNDSNLNDITNFRNNMLDRYFISTAVANFIDSKNYYLLFKEKTSDIMELMYYYGLKYPEVHFSTNNPETLYRDLDKNNHQKYKKASISFNVKNSKKESQKLAVKFLQDFDMPEKAINDVIYGKNIMYSRYDLNIESAYDNDTSALILYFYYDYEQYIPSNNK